jgi:hypothetical protein
MQRHLIAASALTGAVLLLALFSPSAHSLTARECSAKYEAAKAAGTINGMTLNDFRKAECGPAISTVGQNTEQSGATETPKATKKAVRRAKKAKKNETETKSTAAAPASAGGAVFPTAVSSKYSNESAGRARMHTCRDQYNANKANNANGGLRWIQKGGGYYSECNKRLKG